MTAHVDFRAGARAIVPLLPPGAAVGLVTGLAANAVGLSVIHAVVMGVTVYSPTVMLTSFGLFESGAPLVVLLVGSLVVGVKFTLLSLSISSYLDRVSTHWNWLLAYFLWTPVYALAVERFESAPGTDRRGFYLGLAVPLWVTFQATMVAGFVFGAGVPATLQLEFVVPLAFIALVVRLVEGRASAVAAVVAGAAAVGGTFLPLDMGLIVATVAGTAAGLLVASREGS